MSYMFASLICFNCVQSLPWFSRSVTPATASVLWSVLMWNTPLLLAYDPASFHHLWWEWSFRPTILSCLFHDQVTLILSYCTQGFGIRIGKVTVYNLVYPYHFTNEKTKTWELRKYIESFLTLSNTHSISLFCLWKSESDFVYSRLWTNDNKAMPTQHNFKQTWQFLNY